MWADNRESVAAQKLRAIGADQKCDVATDLRQPSAEVAANRTGSNNENLQFANLHHSKRWQADHRGCERSTQDLRGI